jgi:hypothetical protein
LSGGGNERAHGPTTSIDLDFNASLLEIAATSNWASGFHYVTGSVTSARILRKW